MVQPFFGGSNLNENEIIGFVSTGSRRQKILASLWEGQKTVTQISEGTGVHRSHTSSSLRELEDKKLVECTTPKLRIGKLFALTERGRRITRRAPIPDRYYPGGLDLKVVKILDELSIPFAKNIKQEVQGRHLHINLAVIDNLEPRIIIETKKTYGQEVLNRALESTAFRIGELKKGREDLKIILILGGLGKEDSKKSVRDFIEGDYFDVVLHEDDLECVQEEKPTQDNFLEIVRECMNW